MSEATDFRALLDQVYEAGRAIGRAEAWLALLDRERLDELELAALGAQVDQASAAASAIGGVSPGA